MDEMKKELMFAQSPVVFCHNDLTAGNIIYNKDTGTGISECAPFCSMHACDIKFAVINVHGTCLICKNHEHLYPRNNIIPAIQYNQ